MQHSNWRDMNIAAVGLGCWQLGGGESEGDWGQVSDDQALAVLQAAYDAGTRLFDTAEGYGGGRSERRIGMFLNTLPQGARDKVLIATKIGSNRSNTADISAELRRATEASLERLGTSSLFLTQLHCWNNEQATARATWDALGRLQDDGLVKHVGASVETVQQANEAVDAGAEWLQIIFNAFRQRPLSEGLLERCRREQVGVLVRLPLASGLLAGRFGRGGTYQTHDDLPPGDHRRYNRDGQAFNVGETLAGLTLEAGIAAADKALPVLRNAVGHGVSDAQAALRWVLDHPGVTCVIPGASSPEQARANAAAGDLPPLPGDAHAALQTIWRNDVDPLVRGRQ
ncbi:MAG: aldo/keto reductase [Phycisphaerae bacterium]